MIREAVIVSALVLVAGLMGCTTISPEMVEALSKNDASVCASGDVRGGAGAVAGVPSGGYGQGTMTFCRSGKPNAKLEIKPDGSMSITNGAE
jgi:L-aminopeptidase/D-esterase-like protein